jgi:hypothetical protein
MDGAIGNEVLVPHRFVVAIVEGGAVVLAFEELKVL